MGVIIRQSFKATIVSYGGALIGAFLVVFIYPKCLTPSQVGLTNVLLTAATFFAAFAVLGMNSAAIKFFPNFKDSTNNHNGFSLIFIGIPFVGFLLFAIIFILFQNSLMSLFQENSGELNEFMLLIIPFTFFMMYSSIFETYSSLHQRIVVPKIIKEVIVRILTIILIFLFYIQWLSFYQFVIAFVGIYGFSLLLNIIYFNSIFKINLKPSFAVFKKPLKKEMMIFIGLIILIGIGSNIAARVDNFVLSQMKGLAGVGIYTIPFFIASFIEMPSRAMFQITTPILSDALNKKDMQMVDSLYKRVAINQLIISGLLLLLIWINADNVFKIMPNGHIYEVGKYVILFIGLAKVYDAATGLNGQILGNSKYYYYYLWSTPLLGLISIINLIIFIPIFGINGAAIASLITMVLNNSILVFIVYYKLKVQPFSLNNIKAVLVISSFFILNIFLPSFTNPYLDGIIRTILFLVVYLIAIYKFKLSQDINDFINIFINKFLKKK